MSFPHILNSYSQSRLCIRIPGGDFFFFNAKSWGVGPRHFHGGKKSPQVILMSSQSWESVLNTIFFFISVLLRRFTSSKWLCKKPVINPYEFGNSYSGCVVPWFCLVSVLSSWWVIDSAFYIPADQMEGLLFSYLSLDEQLSYCSPS